MDPALLWPSGCIHSETPQRTKSNIHLKDTCLNAHTACKKKAQINRSKGVSMNEMCIIIGPAVICR